MKRYTLGLLTLSIGLTFAATNVLAHHAFTAVYDSNKPVRFTGTITKVDWRNPHTYCYVDVKDASGKVTNYVVEVGNPTTLDKQGWNQDTLKPGDSVTIAGFKAKDGSNAVNGRSVTLPNGKRVLSTADEGEK